YQPVVSGDGTHIVFTSGGTDLVTGFAIDGTNIYVRDLQASNTTLVSVPATGSAGGSSDTPVISHDGSVIAFQSGATYLVDGFVANNGSGPDIYVRDVAAGTTTLLSHSLAGATVSGDNTSQFPAISGNGSTVSFQSVSSDLVADVTDANGTASD